MKTDMVDAGPFERLMTAAARRARAGVGEGTGLAAAVEGTQDQGVSSRKGAAGHRREDGSVPSDSAARPSTRPFPRLWPKRLSRPS